VSNAQDNYDVETDLANYSFSGNLDHVASPNLFLSARSGYWYRDTHDEGVYQGHVYTFRTSNQGMPGVPEDLQGPRLTTNTRLSNRETTRYLLSRMGAQVDATLYATFAGRHALKAGVQWERLREDIVQGQTGSSIQLFWDQALSDGRRGAFGYYTASGNGVIAGRGSLTQADTHSDNVALFVQDAWTVGDRVTLNLGLRAEEEHVPPFTSTYGNGVDAFHFGFGQKLAPRAGVAWDVRGDGRWKAYASWGLFYDTMKLQMPLFFYGGIKQTSTTYALETADWPNLAGPLCPPECAGDLLESRLILPPRALPEEELDPTRLQEAVIGVEHQVSSTVTVGARYVHKQVDEAINFVGDRTDEETLVQIMANPGQGLAAETRYGPAVPRPTRDYDALELVADKRRSGSWSWHASYLLSRLHGNYSGLSAPPNLNDAYANPVMLFEPTGEPLMGVLPADRTHQLKAQLTYDLPFGTTLAGHLQVLSGLPITRTVDFMPGWEFPVAYAGMGSDGRMDTLSQWDLYVQHEFPLSRGRRLQLALNVLNVFDQEAPYQVWAREYVDAVDIDEAAYLAGVDMSQLFEEQGLERDPLFLAPTAFQDPREIRLSVKFLF
jgi:hypothetical protein